jgi:hypothetical protein
LQSLLQSAGFTVLDAGIDPYYATAGLRGAIDAAYCVTHKAIYKTLGINRYDTIWMVGRRDAGEK